MADRCELRAANGIEGGTCEGERCVYWRIVGHLGVDSDRAGCAVKYFQLLDGGGPVAEWLLSVKERVEREHGPLGG